MAATTIRSAAMAVIAATRDKGGFANDGSRLSKGMGSAPPPGEDRACRVVEYGSHERAGGSGQPPSGAPAVKPMGDADIGDRKSTRLNSSHLVISYAVFCLKK